MSILVEYVRREVERGIVDEYVLYMNTPDEALSDREYGLELGKRYPWITIQERPMRHPGPIQRSTGYFYRSATDSDTVYVRLDDDIVYLEESAIENLVTKRLEAPAPVAILGTTWNNAIISYFFQQQGTIPLEWGKCEMYCMDSVGWANGEFAVKIHNLLLDKAEAGEARDLRLYMDYSLQPGTQFSVSCFASLGSMYGGLKEPGVLIPDEEESWHTIHEPLKRGIPNLVTGDALVSHFTFMPQRAHVLNSDTLQRYEALAKKLT